MFSKQLRISLSAQFLMRFYSTLIVPEVYIYSIKLHCNSHQIFTRYRSLSNIIIINRFFSLLRRNVISNKTSSNRPTGCIHFCDYVLAIQIERVDSEVLKSDIILRRKRNRLPVNRIPVHEAGLV